MPKTEYQRLTRSRPRGGFSVAVASRTSLWLGTDHLLFVDSNGYTETYKRFYFRDIQAFMVQKTQTFTIVNVAFTIPFVLFMASAMVTQTTGLKIFLFCMAGFFAFIVLINLLRGQTCRSFLRTAVQIEQLPPLSRVRRAQKVFIRVRPLIVAAQGGELAPQTISNLIREQIQSSATESQGVAQNPGIPPRLES
jgi:hypothetical protein